MKNPITKLAALLLALLSASGLCASAQEMDAKLNRFFQDYLETHFRQQPMAATQLGDHRFDHLLDDLSPGAREGWLAQDRQTLEALPRQVDYTRLSRPGQIDFEIFQQSLTRSIWLTENTHPFEEDPRAYSEYISDCVYLLLTQSTMPSETNVANCLARMEQIPRVVAAAKQNLHNPPRTHLETAIRQNQGAIGFYEKDLFAFAGKTSQLPALKASAQRVAACLKDYQKFLTELLPQAHGDWRLGRERFYRKLELELDAGLTADQVFADAQAEFDRVQRDMYVIARQLWSRYFPKQPLPPDDAPGRRATIQQVLARIGQDHSKPQNLVRDVTETVARVKRFIRDADILRLPEPDTCSIVEMPEFKRGNSTAYMNSPPPLDPKASGFYAVSPPPKDWDAKKVNSYLEEYNRNMLQILTIHEAYPGHYVQLAYANRNPDPIRKVLESGVYVEGWAVYTEQMMLDQGYGQGDLPLRLTQLKFYLRAVANTILDHKMHCDGLTDDEALKFLTEGAYQSEGEARLKVIRAQQSSVQLSTYFVGRMAHYRLRQALERELGAQFNLGRFHEAVLAPGPVPVKYLPELVRASLCPPRVGDAFDQNRKLGRGVNVLGYDPIWRSRDQARFQPKHFRMLKDAGFNSLRVNLSPFRQMDSANGWKVRDSWFATLDWAVKNAQEQGLRVILDLHEYGAMGNDPAGNKEKFLAFWRQLSAHCKDAPESVLFEILNEPSKNLTPALWNDYLREALAIIRETNPTRMVIVGPGFWNSIDHLRDLELPAEDRNLIVTVHYYTPMDFTHQGAAWADRKDKLGVDWLATDKDLALLKKDFDKAAAWAKERNRPLFLGEFGAYDKGPMDSRVRYTSNVARAAEQHGWSWAYWQFDSDFILYDMARDGWVEPIRDALVPITK